MKIRLKTVNDTITWDWWTWGFNLFRKSENKHPCIFSTNYDVSATGFSKYWIEIGRKELLVEIICSNSKGVSSFELYDLIRKTISSEYPSIPVLVLFDIEMDSLNTLSLALPGVRKKVLLEEFVAIPCSNIDYARKLALSIPDTRARACVVYNGLIDVSNKDVR